MIGMHKWKSFGASLIGPMHIKNNIPNQDSFLIKKKFWGNILVVSDGLGSKKHSDVGSKAICNAIVEVAKKRMFRKAENKEDFLQIVHKKWISLIHPYTATECAATCLFVIQNKKSTSIGMLGDGMIVCICKDLENSVVITEEKENGFSNSTNSLRSDCRIQDWTIKTLDTTTLDSIVLCSDGIADDIPTENQIDFCKELVENYAPLKSKKQVEELQSMLINWPVPRHSDDKTLVCAYNRGEYL